MSGEQHKKIILDTDLCGDCDDVGAMAVLLNLDRLGYAKTLEIPGGPTSSSIRWIGLAATIFLTAN